MARVRPFRLVKNAAAPLNKLWKTRHFDVLHEVQEVRKVRRMARSVGLVPTMGALHEGHLALIRQAAKENHQVFVSIYVNPTQFGVNEDLSSYPRTWDVDKRKLEALHREFRDSATIKGQISTIFMLSTKEMYPGIPPSSEINGEGSFVTITPLSSRLEGATRPVFFRGVATVCMKLLNIVKPENVYFGQKDVQQTFVVKRMVQDFHLDTKVCIGPTISESDGLAMSSRNMYLGERRRKIAITLLNSFKAVQHVFARGARKRRYLYNAAVDELEKVRRQQQALPKSQRANFEIDYISIADPETMDELEEVSSAEGAILSGAIKMLPIEDTRDGEVLGAGGDQGPVLLIDNIRLDLLSSKAGFIP